MNKTFEEFLQYKFTTEMHPEILDDDLPDRFNDYEWDTEELIKYADEYTNSRIDEIIGAIQNQRHDFINAMTTTKDLDWNNALSQCADKLKALEQQLIARRL